MKILVIGSGGREHALCWSLSDSPLCDELYCAPGNAGIQSCAKCVPINANDINKLVSFAEEKCIDFVVVGPEEPLVLGIADKLRNKNIKTNPRFGFNQILFNHFYRS